MKTLSFALRVFKEILRDPMSFIFGLGFPIVLIVLLSVIQANIPVSLFEIDRLAPGITAFGLSFMALFAGSLVARDRENAFLQRLYATPMTAVNFILGYSLPLIPLSMAQSLICYGVALIYKLPISAGILLSTLFNIPLALFYIGLGLAFGSILSSKAVGGACGALLTNLSAWLSGIWFDLKLVGGTFEKIAGFLPFTHSVSVAESALKLNFVEILPHLLWVTAYMLVAIALAIALFTRQMKK